MSDITSIPIVYKLTGQHNMAVRDALYFPEVGAVLTTSKDRNLLCWLKRDDGSFWPSVNRELTTAGTCLTFSSGHVYAGIENGRVVVFEVSDDFNNLNLSSSIEVSDGHLISINVDNERDLLITTSDDRTLALHRLSTQEKLDESLSLFPWTAATYDPASRSVFSGDSRGTLVVHTISDDLKFTEVVKLKEHRGAITCLEWSTEDQYLFTASKDKAIICWDIGGKEGKFYRLKAHKSTVIALNYDASSKQLISTSEDGMIAIWDMSVEREMVPKWTESDECQRCGKPFFWNLSGMWQKKTFSLFVRQHHCRISGKAVCDDCSSRKMIYPQMGFEFPVRVCIDDAQEKESEAIEQTAMLFQSRPMSVARHQSKTCLLAGKGTDLYVLDLKPIFEPGAQGFRAGTLPTGQHAIARSPSVGMQNSSAAPFTLSSASQSGRKTGLLEAELNGEIESDDDW